MTLLSTIQRLELMRSEEDNLAIILEGLADLVQGKAQLKVEQGFSSSYIIKFEKR